MKFQTLVNGFLMLTSKARNIQRIISFLQNNIEKTIHYGHKKRLTINCQPFLLYS